MNSNESCSPPKAAIIGNASALFGLDRIASDNHIRSLLDLVPPSELSPMYQAILTALDSGGYLAPYRSTRHDLLVALDATQYFSSSKIHCEQCNTQQHDDGRITYSHSVITPIILAPGHPEVMALEPEFITPQDGHEKQDCENTAAKRWLQLHGVRMHELGVTILGDDLYCKQPLCQAILDQGLSFILVCQPKSHTTLYEWVDGLEATGGVQTHQVSYRKGQHHYTDTYRFVNEVPLKAGDNAAASIVVLTALADGAVQIEIDNNADGIVDSTETAPGWNGALFRILFGAV